jgi:membrane peptidoglycan carboxypeptidase
LEGELALLLDASYSTNDVLRMYLAEVYFGHGSYGLPAAASGYFGVTSAQLSWPQASMLAALVQAPSAQGPQRPPVHRAATPAARPEPAGRYRRPVAGQADVAFAAPLGLR